MPESAATESSHPGPKTVQRVSRFWRQDVWKRYDGQPCYIRWTMIFARVIAILGQGVQRNNIPILAGALSYYSLVALGPLLAVMILVSSIVSGEGHRDRLATSITDLVYAIAPALREADTLSRESAPATNQADASTIDTRTTATGKGVADVRTRLKPASQVRTVVESLIRSTRSGTFGAAGTVVLIFVSIQLLATIEQTLNAIWGVSKDRPIASRIVFYWFVLSAGGLLGALIITFGTVAQLAKVAQTIPLGGVVLQFWGILGPFVAFVLLVALLTLFYRVLPNTQVQWLPASVGAVLTALMLGLNQQLSFLYIGQVTRQQSLLGIVGILPVALFGLYVFWLLLLVGGQVVYALQNVNILRNERAWESLSPQAGELFGLHLLIRIARPFREGQPAPDAEQLSSDTGAPMALVNRTLGTLRRLGFVSLVSRPTAESKKEITAFQPAIALEKISVRKVHDSLQQLGEDEGLISGKDLDPALLAYQKRLDDIYQAHFDESLEDLVSRYPTPKNCVSETAGAMLA